MKENISDTILGKQGHILGHILRLIIRAQEKKTLNKWETRANIRLRGRYEAGRCNSFSVRAGMCKRGDMCLVF